MTHTLLLADDSSTIHRVVELTFADEDIVVVAVDHGDKAIAALNRVPPDIVLADIGMPGRSGYEVARHVKETPELAHIPVLLLTGAFEPVDPAVVAAMRCEGVLTKPFEPAALVRRVKELLELSPAPSPAVPPGDAVRPVALVASAPPPPVPFAALHVVERTHIDEPVAPRVETFPRMDARDEPFLRPESQRSDADIESYFEELDHAFATLASPEREALPALDRFVKEPVAPPSPDRLRGPTPASASLVDAFAALLAAERTASSPQVAPLRPIPAPAPPAVTTDEIVERAARYALDALPEEAIRRIVEDVVSATAERLIREEIERIKRNIK